MNPQSPGTFQKHPAKFQPPHSSETGVALVLVLAFLVLITALVIAFFSSVSTELTGTKSYTSGVTAKQLADSAAQMVMGSIKQATSGTNSTDGSATAWASQPGMIRTYDNSGNLLTCYKLYSSDNMVVNGSTLQSFASDAPLPSTWSNQPALYTDINSPIATGTSFVFPVVDGNAMKSLTISGTSELTYSTSGTQDIAGFYVDPNKVSYNTAASLSPTNTPVPMPVKWIYVLRDGKLTVPTGVDGTGKLANWNGSSNAPSSSNPIVGRIAFWTDDESSKVNINTASEGTYWDTPRENYSADGTFATNAPMQHEYQRYPGHPAMTSLSTIFSGLTNPEQIYQIVPRVAPGGSQEGTVKTTRGASVAAPVPDSDRLFTTVDELLFNPLRTQNDASNITRAKLEQSRFFITANSRSPDVNLFGKPRVSIWPESVNSGTAYRTTYDRLIAFCSTVNGHPFYFQRSDPTDPNIDLPANSGTSGLNRNRSVLEYLRYLTSQNIPGFGGNFAAKYATSNGNGGTDRDQILTEIFDYIRSTNLVDKEVSSPYAPGVRITSWYAGSGQVVPIQDTLYGTMGFGRIRTVKGASILFIANGDDTTYPTIPPSTPATQAPKDLVTGTYPSPIGSGSVRVQACFLPQLFDPSVGSVFDFPNFQVVITGLDQFTLGGQSMGFSSSITLNQSNYSMDNAFWGDQIGIRQVASSALVGASLDLPKGSGTTAAFTGGNVTITLKTSSSATNPGTVIQSVVLNFPDGTFPLPTVFKNTNTNIATGTLPITDATDSGTSSAYVRNYDYGSLIPDTRYGTYFNMRYFSHDTTSSGTIHGRLNSMLNAASWILSNDVLRSVGVSHGDVRLVAAQKNPPAPGTSGYPFGTVGSYASTTAMAVGTHTWWDGDGRPYYGALAGHLVQNANYDNGGTGMYSVTSNHIITTANQGGLINFSNAQDIPFNGVTVGKTTAYANGDLPGDWDNGINTLRDGPYINKADEGDMGSSNDIPYNWKGQTGNFVLATTLFTPNRLMPSAVMFGSLPTGVFANRPWQTLLFHSDPSGVHAGNKNRKGDGTSSSGMPGDHLFLDLFNMPVVEPYAISEPLSTAGRINMNYQIVPFTYINRDTGIRAILKSEQVISIAESQASNYKLTYTASQTPVHYAVDPDETLKGFTARFASNDIFRSASEICTLPIVPSGATYAQLANTSIASNYWTTSTTGHRLTGDNSRERLYATIYPRLTTKSNTFTVHMRVQTLKKLGVTGVATWDESRDQVMSEYRGSQIIERYVDAADASIPDYTDATVTAPIDTFYKFRVVSSKKFTP